MAEDHLRERRFCDVLDGLATADSLDRPAASRSLRFLTEELDVHLSDEAEDLFTLLERRCTEEDAIDSAIGRIRADQMEVIRLLPEVCAILRGCLETGADLTADGRATLTRFAGHVRRRLVAENAILLPIARARLTRADLRTLSRAMLSRRGLPDFPERTDAE